MLQANKVADQNFLHYQQKIAMFNQKAYMSVTPKH